MDEEDDDLVKENINFQDEFISNSWDSIYELIRDNKFDEIKLLITENIIDFSLMKIIVFSAICRSQYEFLNFLLQNKQIAEILTVSQRELNVIISLNKSVLDTDIVDFIREFFKIKETDNSTQIFILLSISNFAVIISDHHSYEIINAERNEIVSAGPQFYNDLHYAVCLENHKLIAFIAQKRPALLNVYDKSIPTAIKLAAINNMWRVVDFLLVYGSYPLIIGEEFNDNVIDICINNNQTMLFKKAFSKFIYSIKHRTDTEYTQIISKHLYIILTKLYDNKMFDEFTFAWRNIIEKELQLIPEDYETGKTIFDFLIDGIKVFEEDENYDIADFLINNKFNVNRFNNPDSLNLHVPIHYAVRSLNINAVLYLLARNADVTIIDPLYGEIIYNIVQQKIRHIVETSSQSSLLSSYSGSLELLKLNQIMFLLKLSDILNNFVGKYLLENIFCNVEFEININSIFAVSENSSLGMKFIEKKMNFMLRDANKMQINNLILTIKTSNILDEVKEKFLQQLEVAKSCLFFTELEAEDQPDLSNILADNVELSSKRISKKLLLSRNEERKCDLLLDSDELEELSISDEEIDNLLPLAQSKNIYENLGILSYAEFRGMLDDEA